MDDAPILSNKTRPKSFYRWRWAIFAFAVLSDLLVFFQRACANVVAPQMAEDYGVDVTKLSIFSSMYFYMFGLLQPFTGLMADVLEPGYIVGSGILISAAGTLLTGVSHTLLVGCIGRFFVGIGCSAIFICAMRLIANWFELKYYGRYSGLFVSLASVGGIIAQYPLAAYAGVVGWRWSFYTFAIMGFIIGALDLFIIRGSPSKKGFDNVNIEETDPSPQIKKKLEQLWINIKNVVSCPSFWLLSLWAFGVSGPYFSVNGMWGGVYLQDVVGYDSEKAGICLMGLSVANMTLAFLYPIISDILKTKKWLAFGLSLASVGIVMPFAYCPQKLSFPVIILLLFLYSATTNTVTNIVFPLVREYFDAAASATSISFVNAFSFIGSSIQQILTGVIIKKFGKNGNKYTEEGYKYGFWLFNGAFQLVGALALLFVKDAMYHPPEHIKVSSRDYESIADMAESKD